MKRPYESPKASLISIPCGDIVCTSLIRGMTLEVTPTPAQEWGETPPVAADQITHPTSQPQS